MGLEDTIETGTQISELEEKARLGSILRDTGTVAKEFGYSLLPSFLRRPKNYTRYDLFLDLLKIGCVALGGVELVEYASAGRSVDAAYAFRNLGFWAAVSIPHFYAGIKNKFQEFDNYIKELYQQLEQEKELSKKQRTMFIADQIIEDKAVVGLFMLPWLIETGYKILYLPYGHEFVKWEAAVGVGPTMLQHYAMGIGLTKLIENAQLYWAKANQVYDEKFKAKVKWRSLGIFLGFAFGWEGFEKISLFSGPPIPKDTVFDLIMGTWGSLRALCDTKYYLDCLDYVTHHPLTARIKDSIPISF